MKMDMGDKAERKMTEGEMMKDFDFITKRYSMPISKKYTAAQLNAHVGKNAGLIFVTVPLEWVKGGNTPGNRLQVTNRIGPLFGDSVCCRVGEVGKTSKPTGRRDLAANSKTARGGSNKTGQRILETSGRRRRVQAERDSCTRKTLPRNKHLLPTQD